MLVVLSCFYKITISGFNLYLIYIFTIDLIIILILIIIQLYLRKLLRLVKNLNMTGHFLWVASDSWGTKKESIDSNDEVAEGAITFSPKSYEIKGEIIKLMKIAVSI